MATQFYIHFERRIYEKKYKTFTSLRKIWRKRACHPLLYIMKFIIECIKIKILIHFFNFNLTLHIHHKIHFFISKIYKKSIIRYELQNKNKKRVGTGTKTGTRTMTEQLFLK